MRRFYDGVRPDHPLATPPPLHGASVPTTREEAASLRAKLEAAGGDYVDPFKTPAYRILTDESIVEQWEEEGVAPGTPLGQAMIKHLNGYDFLEFMRQEAALAADSYCAHQAKQGNAEIGRANTFVSWGLASTLHDLIERLEAYVEEEAAAGLDASQAFLWVCNFCIRQSGGKDDDVPRLGQMVQECGRTVMFLEPWDKMVAASEGEKVNCLSRAWCVFEVRGWVVG